MGSHSHGRPQLQSGSKQLERRRHSPQARSQLQGHHRPNHSTHHHRTLRAIQTQRTHTQQRPHPGPHSHAA